MTGLHPNPNGAQPAAEARDGPGSGKTRAQGHSMLHQGAEIRPLCIALGLGLRQTVPTLSIVAGLTSNVARGVTLETWLMLFMPCGNALPGNCARRLSRRLKCSSNSCCSRFCNSMQAASYVSKVMSNGFRAVKLLPHGAVGAVSARRKGGDCGSADSRAASEDTLLLSVALSNSAGLAALELTKALLRSSGAAVITVSINTSAESMVWSSNWVLSLSGCLIGASGDCSVGISLDGRDRAPMAGR